MSTEKQVDGRTQHRHAWSSWLGVRWGHGIRQSSTYSKSDNEPVLRPYFVILVAEAYTCLANPQRHSLVHMDDAVK